MTFGETDQLAINTIRILAVSLNFEPHHPSASG
jgi:hypothetical protein